MRRRRRKRKSRIIRFITGVLTLILAGMILFAAVLSKKELRDQVKETIQGQMAQNIPYEEPKIKEEDVGKKFYYEQLKEEEKLVYKEILQGLQDHSEEIYLHSADAGRTNELFKLLLKDHPGIFWCDGTAKATQYEGEEAYTVLKPVYTYDTEQRQKMEKEIDQEVESCLSGMGEKSGDYEKILYVFEYIVDTVEYDADSSDNQNIYSVFVGKRSVCAGYSKATQYLLEQAGVFCTYVTGTTTGGESHAWNLVKCDGNYYYVDTTWGDPVFLAKEQEIDNNYVSYDYMCCDDEQLQKTHIPDEDISLPACTSMDKNYYVVNGMYFDKYNKEAILKKMNETISAKENPSVFKFADMNIYEQARKDIFGELIERSAQNLAKLYGLDKVSYTYMDDEEMNKIVIYWKYE